MRIPPIIAATARRPAPRYGRIFRGLGRGGTGTVTLSANATDTISAATVLFSPWIETPWHVKSNGNVGDLIKIGVKN